MMKICIRLLPSVLLLFFSCSLAPAGAQDEPSRLRRADSFLGIHFDFHAGPDCNEVGRNTTEKMVNSVIDIVHPDYIQIDCKGHGGYSSYPTKVGNPAPGIIGDPLRIWRDVTADRGIALYMHYSGVWDMRAVELHPDWAVVGSDGKRSDKITSVFGPYVDSLMIPQMKELASVYDVDGIWVDGECWGTAPDYGSRPVSLFKEATGADEAPVDPEDPYWYEWKQFHREAFRGYIRHYLAEVRSEYPDLQICSNWAFSHHMSEPVSASVDFLSGDYAPKNSVNSARIAGRYLSRQGMPWDLMAWSFAFDEKPLGQKPAVQLMREAAVTLALGGGIQMYFMQNRDGSVRLDELDAMAEVAAFARARQPYCHRSIQIPQVALLMSTYDYQHHDSDEDPSWLYPQYTESLSGIMQCLLENQYSVDIVNESTLLPDMGRFPLIVVPECQNLSTVFCEDLIDYARKGGSLLVTGEKMTDKFADMADVDLRGNRYVCVQAGAGKIGFIPEDISRKYDRTQDEELRNRVGSLVEKLFPDPLVEVEGSPFVDVSVSTLGGRYLVHLVNTSGDHRTADFIDHVEPVGPLRISISCPERPSEIVLQPYGKVCDFEYDDGKANLTLEKLDIYDIIEIKLK